MNRKMKRIAVCVLTLAMLAGLLGACSTVPAQPSAEISSSPAATPSVSESATPTPSETASVSPSAEQSVQPSKSAEVSDEEIRGTVEGRTYKNSVAGFELTYPEGYDINDREGIEETYADVISSAKETYTDPAELKKALQLNVPVSSATTQSKEIYSGMYIVVADISDELPVDVMDYANSTVNHINETSTTAKMEEAVPVKIGGVDGALAEGTQTFGEDSYPEKEYYCIRGNYLVAMVLQGGDEDSIGQIMKALDTVKMY
jgi:hypothetical protein